jgi:predicted transcriptional regulator
MQRGSVDGRKRRRYDLRMSEARGAEQSDTTSDDAELERARVVAKIERGLADVKAGRVVPHAEVMARFVARYGSKK